VKPKNPALVVPPRHFTQVELDYAARRGVTEDQLQAKHQQAIADGVEVNAIRLIVACIGDVDVARKVQDGR